MYHFKTIFCSLFIAVFIVSCSSNDDTVLDLQQNYLNARVGELSYELSGENGNFTAQRIIKANGSVTLLIEISDLNGDGFNIIIPFYNGAGIYHIEKDNLASGSISFKRMNPFSHWVCDYPGADGLDNYIEIVNDDQLYIEGNFSFWGRNDSDSSVMVVTDGKFGIISSAD